MQRTFLFSPSMRDRLKGLRQVDGKKGSSADLLVENLAKEAKNSGFLLRVGLIGSYLIGPNGFFQKNPR